MRLLLLLASALLLLAACSDKPDAVAVATREPASPTATATRIVEPATADAALAPPSADLTLPPELPRVRGAVVSAEQFADRSIAVVWRVDAAPAAVVEELAGALAASLDLILDERAPGGGVLAFEGALVSGHYLITTDAGATLVELRLDAPGTVLAPLPQAVALPDGYPLEGVPVFPGAVVASASAQALTGGGTRFVVAFETPRQVVEVMGFYRDLLSVAGWKLAVREAQLDASSADGAVTLTVTGGSRTRGVLTVDWTAP